MRYGLIALLLAFVMPASAVERNLEKLYRQIDDAISHSPEYVAAYENKIKEAKDAYAREWSSEKRLGQILQIFDLYKAYNNDSALSYIQQYINHGWRNWDIPNSPIRERSDRRSSVLRWDCIPSPLASSGHSTVTSWIRRHCPAIIWHVCMSVAS